MLVRTIVEMVGAPKEHVERKFNESVANIEKLFVVKKKVINPVELRDDKFWSVFCEFEIEFKALEELAGFCFDFMPGSVEVLEPYDFKSTNIELTDFFNVLQARLHEVDMVAKTLNAKMNVLDVNTKNLFANFVKFLARQGDKTLSEISVATGIGEAEVRPLLDQLVKEKKVYVVADKYSLK